MTQETVIQWKANSAAREAINGLDAVSQLSEAGLSIRLGPELAAQITAHVRAHPLDAAASPRGTSATKSMLARSLATFRQGDREGAGKLALSYVHAGWIAALAAGGLTWMVAAYLVGVSGASRELTEGFSSLFAAVVLLGVGMWMHQKSVAGRWQVYLKQKLSSALNRRTAWLLFSLAFIAVYREVFETVLFYAALWTEGNGAPLLAGLESGLR